MLRADRTLAELAKDAEGSARRIAKGSNARRERVRFTQLSSYIETVALELLRQSREGRGASRGVRLNGVRSLEWLDAGSAQGRSTTYLEMLQRLQPSVPLSKEEGQSKRPPNLPRPGFWTSLLLFLKALWTALVSSDQSAGLRVKLARRDVGASLGDDRSINPPQGAGWPSVGRSCYPPGDDVATQRKIFERLTLQTLATLYPALDESARVALAELALEKAEFYRAAESSGAAVVEVVSAACGETVSSLQESVT
jgi:hypothetical protein